MACIVIRRTPFVLQPTRRRNRPDCDCGLWSDFQHLDKVLDQEWDKWMTGDDVPLIKKCCQRTETDETGTRNGLANAKSNTAPFRVELDTKEFSPEEISVTVRDQQVRVEAEHREEGEGRQVYRRMVQNFSLPPGTDPETLQSRLSKEGVLTVLAPTTTEKQIPVTQEAETSETELTSQKPSEEEQKASNAA